MAILERISKNSQENIDEVFTRLYRYLLRPDIYYVATRWEMAMIAKQRKTLVVCFHCHRHVIHKHK